MRVLLVLLLVACPVTASAQQPPVPEPSWDAALLAGWLAVHADVPQPFGYRDSWFHAGEAGVVAGRYWSPHFKTEVAFTNTSEGQRYVQRRATLPVSSGPGMYTVHEYRQRRSLAATLTWQFLRNAWAHPFLSAGVEVASDRIRADIAEQFFYTAPATRVLVTPARTEGPERKFVPRAIVSAGAKAYVTERLFVRPELTIGIRNDDGHAAFRFGVGVDF